MRNDVKISKGWPDEILQVERVGNDVGLYYLANVVELEPEGMANCRFTGNTPDEAIEQALDAIRAKGTQQPDFDLVTLEKEEERLEKDLEAYRERANEVENKLAAVKVEIYKAIKAPPLLKATELLEEEKMLKQAAMWIDPETERGFQRVAFRLYKDRDGDGDPDIIASWHR